MRVFPYMYIKILAAKGGGTRYIAFDIVGALNFHHQNDNGLSR